MPDLARPAFWADFASWTSASAHCMSVAVDGISGAGRTMSAPIETPTFSAPTEVASGRRIAASTRRASRRAVGKSTTPA